MALTRCYRDGELIDEGFPVEKVSDHLAEEDTVVWFDLCEPSEEDLARDQRGARPAPARRGGRHPPDTSVRSSTTTRRTCS